MASDQQARRSRALTSVFGTSSVNESQRARLLPTLVLGQLYFESQISASLLRPMLRDRLCKIWRFRALLQAEAPGEKHRETGQFWRDICFTEVPIESLDMDYHVVEVSGVTSQQGMDQFQSDLYEGKMDLDKPQWRFYVLNGVEDPNAPGKKMNVLLFSVNHAVADGISLVHALLNIVDGSPEEVDKTSGTRATTKKRAAPLNVGCFHCLGALASGCGVICDELCGRGDTPNKLKTKDHRHPSRSKSVANAASVSLARVKEVKDAVPGATVNDVLMAMITATLRAYYSEQGEVNVISKGSQVRGSFAVNMRKTGEDVLSEESFGNRVSVGAFKFPLACADYKMMVQECAAQTQKLKNSPEFSIRQSLTDFAVKWSRNVDSLTDALLDAYGQQTAMLSNVAGPPEMVSLAGSKVIDLRFYAFAGIGLYFGVLTYNGKVNAGIALDPTCDEAKNLAKFWEPEFAKLYAACVGRELPAE